MISRPLKRQYSMVFCAAVLALGLLGSLLARQGNARLVSARDDVEQINDAILISNIAVGGKTVECGLFIEHDRVQPVTPFQASGDWLQQMTISLVNRTNKTIVYGSVIMHFVDTGDCVSLPCAGTELHFGHMPAIDAYDGRTGQPLRLEHPERPPLGWQSEQTYVVHVSDYMDKIERSLSNFMSESAVGKVNIYRSAFYFEDGMRWTPGRYSVPDPERPGKFNHLPVDYFPGRRGNNWPPGYDQ